MVTIAFVKKETGLEPCHPLDVHEGDIFYLVENGERGPLQKATGRARPVCEPGHTIKPEDGRWEIPAEEVQ